MLGKELETLKVKIQRYKNSIKHWSFDFGETQWRNRAKDFYRTIKDFDIKINDLEPLKNSNYSSCVLKSDDFFNSASMPVIAGVVSECEGNLTNAILQSSQLSQHAACESILGAGEFDYSKNNYNKNYHKMCF